MIENMTMEENIEVETRQIFLSADSWIFGGKASG